MGAGMAADYVTSAPQFRNLLAAEECRLAQTVRRDEEMPTPAAIFESWRDPGRGAHASVVKSKEQGPAGSIPVCEIDDVNGPAGERRPNGIQMALEIARFQLIGGGGGAGETARVPLA